MCEAGESFRVRHVFVVLHQWPDSRIFARSLSVCKKVIKRRIIITAWRFVICQIQKESGEKMAHLEEGLVKIIKEAGI